MFKKVCLLTLSLLLLSSPLMAKTESGYDEANPVTIYGHDAPTTIKPLSVDSSGKLNVNATFSGTIGTVAQGAAGVEAWLVDGSGHTQPVSGTVDVGTVTTLPSITGAVTANAGTNLNTSLLALESGGNLAAIKTDVDKIPSQGQALSSASMPVVLPAAQITTLTPPAAITNYANETGGNLATLAGIVSSSKAAVKTADGDITTLGAKTDDKSTATDTTSVSVVSLLKEISHMEQAPASRAVTNTGTFAVQSASTMADGANVTLGAKADARSTATDTTAVSLMQVMKEISYMEQNPASRAVTTNNATVNFNKIKGQDPDTGNGTAGSDTTLRVTLASDSTGQVNIIAPTSMGSGQKTVTTAGSRVALASSTPCLSVTIKALPGNTGYIYVGTAAGVSSSVGFILSKNETVTVDVNNLASVGLDSSVNGEGVSFIYAVK